MGSAQRVAVPRLWPGATVVCIGGGPSLTAEDVAYCRHRARVVAVNDAYRLAPWADVLYACDAKWWDWHKGAPAFAGLKYALERRASKWPGVQVLENTGHDGLEAQPTGVKTGRNSGYQAINIAVHLGATRIVLLGYDMMRGPNKQEHWFGDHPTKTHSPYPAFAEKFKALVVPLQKLGVTVINCSRRTALNIFQRQPLEATL